MHSTQINSFLSSIEKELSKIKYGINPKELYQPIEYTMGLGGKRIRPLFLLLSCDLFEGRIADAMNPALAVEIFHNFTLVHDDIMDNAPLRRNKPTVYKQWNKNIALLSGDVMLVWTYRLLSKCPKSKFLKVLSVFNEIAIQVCEGQQLDMNLEALPLLAQTGKNSQIPISDSEEKTLPHANLLGGVSYIEMISLKTAALIAGCCQIGAILGGASRSDANHLFEFGKNLGIAFQLQDDLLDVFGNSAKFGKQTGGDIIENKKTFLLLKAFELANETGRKKLHDIFLKDKISSTDKINAVKKIYDNLGIKGETEKEIKKYFSLAKKELIKIKAAKNKKLQFLAFVSGLMKREM